MKRATNLIIKYFFLIPLYIVLSQHVHSQNNMPIQWQACFGGSDFDIAYDIVESENGYLVIGETDSNDGDVSGFHGGNSDVWVVNIDSIGNLLWSRCYGGSSVEYPGNIIKDNEGNFYFAVETYSNDGDIQSGNHGDYDIWVVKINPQGEILWEQCYGGSGRDYYPNIKLLNSGNLLVSCQSTSYDGDVPENFGYHDAWLFEISPQGQILKSKVFGNILQNYIWEAIGTPDGGYFFLSCAMIIEGMIEGEYNGGQHDVWAVKLDSEMNIEWQKLYGGSNDDNVTKGVLSLDDGYIFTAVTNSNDGDVTGYHWSSDDEYDIWVVRIDLEGNIIWQDCFGGYDVDYPRVLFSTDDDGFIIWGYTSSNHGDVSGNHSVSGLADIWMFKLNSEGELQWQQCYGGQENEDLISGLVKKSDHNWVVASYSRYNSGDVNCDLHYANDYWIFEIKDTTVNIINEFVVLDKGFKIYPNPAKDFVVFEFSDLLQNYTIEIYNTIGVKIDSFIIDSKQTIWDCRDLEKGIYLYKTTIDNTINTGKVIIR